MRNIVSIRQSQDLFDDLSGNPNDWTLAHQVELQAKPPHYQSSVPIIDRPFEDAEWFNAITWPFKNWQSSRFSDGSYGVWYGSDTVETTVYESAYHWYHGLLRDAGFDRELVFAERKVYSVRCSAALLDFRQTWEDHPELLHRTDYSFAQSVGARIHREGHPGLLVPSVRRTDGKNVAVFNANVLSNPRLHCQLTYHLRGEHILVERQPGETWMSLNVIDFA